MINLEDYIRNIPNFPSSGVLFKDITPLLSSAEATRYCVEKFVGKLEDKRVDKVVAIESRGFFFGILLAQRLNVGFVPIRKPNKLPFNIISEPYELEYGQGSLEIHEDAIGQGDQVLVHDDVLATGGTARAACNLVERMGGEVVQCNFLLEIKALKGREKLTKHELISLLSY